MNIIHFTRRFFPSFGGVQTFVRNLAELQIRDRHNVKVITFVDKGADNSSEKLRGIKTIRLPYVEIYNQKFNPFIIGYFQKADIVHIHNIDLMAEYIGLSKPLHRNTILLSTHGGFFHEKKLLKLRYMRLYSVSSISLKFYDYLLCTSEKDCKLFGKYAKRYSRFTNGIFLPDICKKFFEKSNFSILYLGRLQKHKKLDLLIKILTVLKNKYKQKFICDIAGPDWGIKEFLLSRINIERLNKNIFFHGIISESKKRLLLSRCEFFICPSEFESFGISLLEGMSWGNIVLANDIQAHREFIINGVNGFIADFRNIEDVCRLIIKIHNLPIEEKLSIQKNARITAEKYSWSRKLGQLYHIYESVRK